MKVEPVTAEDLPEIAGWYRARGLDVGWPREWLSDLGFQVRGVAAGWLITTNTARALIEDFIANPAVDSIERRAALVAVENRIVEEARARGFRYILGNANLRAMHDHARALGYHVTDPHFSVVFKDLSK